MNAARDTSASLEFTVEVADDFNLSRLQAPEIARAAVPGQFVALRVSKGSSPLLRIPLSIFWADARAGTIDILCERRGPKSGALADLPRGSRLACLGPLGNAFPEPVTGTAPLLVGGGVGIPPLLFLGRRWRAGGGPEAELLAGARHRSKHLPAAMLGQAADTMCLATDDGSLGHPGLVTDLLAERLARDPACTVYTCGPQPMMRAVAAQCASASVKCYASLEEYMACGIGVCVGCVVRLAGGEDEDAYSTYGRVCVDGPVFDATSVVW